MYHHWHDAKDTLSRIEGTFPIANNFFVTGLWDVIRTLIVVRVELVDDVDVAIEEVQE